MKPYLHRLQDDRRLGGLLSTVAPGGAVAVAWTRVVGVECGRHTHSEYVLSSWYLDLWFPKIC